MKKGTSDGIKVAVMMNKDDLRIVILALSCVAGKGNRKAAEMKDDLVRLLEEVFPK